MLERIKQYFLEKLPNNKNICINKHFVGWILLGIILLFVHLRLKEYAFDDAYIHFRVVENYIETGKPYFNLNDPLKTSTSTGWIMLLSALLLPRLLGVSIHTPTIVAILNSGISLAGAIIFYLFLKKTMVERRHNWALLAFIPGYLALILPSSIGLMETPSALLLAGIGLYLFTNHTKSSLAVIAVGSGFRLELGLLLIILSIYAVRSKKLSPINVFLNSGLALSPIILFDLIYFHTIIPQSIIAKSSLYNLTPGRSFNIFLLSLSEYGKLPFFTHNIGYQRIVLFIFLLPLLSILAFMQKKLFFSKHQNPDFSDDLLILLMLWSTGTLLIYITRSALIFPWYIPLIMIPILVIVFKSLDEKVKTFFRVNLIMTFLLTTIISIPLVFILLSAITSPVYYPGFSQGARVRQYLSVGEELNKKYPLARLMTSEIGGLGYSFRGIILDAAGLASSDAVEIQNHKPLDEQLGLGIIPYEYAELHIPEIIVSYDLLISPLLSNFFFERYHINIHQLYLADDYENCIMFDEKIGHKERVCDLWNITSLYIYIRKDLLD
jgi:hypothetical protein